VKLNVLNRTLHYWGSFVVALPLLVMIGSGLLLQTKKHWTWVQPAEQRGTGSAPAIDLEGVLGAVKQVREHGVQSWDDVNRIDLRPGRSVAKVWLNNGWEVQVDLGTGRVLQSAYRRSDLIEAIHDGSLFGGDWIKLGLFLPAGLVLLLLWLSGMWMWWVTFAGKRRRTLVRARAGP
jgi:uncharacterized iron-regulated membrane protein